MTPRFKSVTLKKNPKTIKTKQNKTGFSKPKDRYRKGNKSRDSKKFGEVESRKVLGDRE